MAFDQGKTKTYLGQIRSGIDVVLAWRGTSYIILVLMSGILLFPIYWIFATSFKLPQEIYQWPPTLFPKDVSISNYVVSLVRSPILKYIGNSTLYSLCVTAFVVFMGTITTYGLSVYRYRGSNRVTFMFFATRIIPPQTLWLPFIIFFSRIGLTSTRGAVIIFGIVIAYPLCVWILKGIFDAFPREIIDSALIDGCSRLGALFRVVVPVIAPAIAAVGIISFLWSWNEFMFPMLMLNRADLYPITVGIYHFVGDQGIDWGPLCASAGLAILPGLIFFIIAQRFIVEGLTQGALK